MGFNFNWGGGGGIDFKELKKMMELDLETNRFDRQGPWSAWNWNEGPDGRWTQSMQPAPGMELGMDRLMQRSQGLGMEPYTSPNQFSNLLDAKMANQMFRHGTLSEQPDLTRIFGENSADRPGLFGGLYDPSSFTGGGYGGGDDDYDYDNTPTAGGGGGPNSSVDVGETQDRTGRPAPGTAGRENDQWMERAIQELQLNDLQAGNLFNQHGQSGLDFSNIDWGELGEAGKTILKVLLTGGAGLATGSIGTGMDVWDKLGETDFFGGGQEENLFPGDIMDGSSGWGGNEFTNWDQLLPDTGRTFNDFYDVNAGRPPLGQEGGMPGSTMPSEGGGGFSGSGYGTNSILGGGWGRARGTKIQPSHTWKRT